MTKTITKDVLNLIFPASEYQSKVHIACRRPGEQNIRLVGYVDRNNLADYVQSLTMLKYDYYLTPNTLIADKRTTENVFSLNNLVIDADIHDKDLTQQERDEMIEEFLVKAKRDLRDTKTLPQWNITHCTGRGVHLWWCIEETSSQLSWLYLIAVNRLIKAFQWLLEQYPDIKLTIDTGASRRIAGYFRLFGTYNTATGTKTSYAIETIKRYDLNDMLEEYTLEQIDEEEQPDHDKSSKVAEDKTYKGLQYKRIRFIEKKVERMNNDCVGMRDIMTFLYYTAQRQVTDRCTAQNRTIYFNNNFYDPLPKSKLTDIFKYIDSKEVLKFKNETFLDWLNADEQERNEYNNMQQKPNGTRDMERKLNKAERDKAIKQFALQNKTNDEIALIVGCSKRTVVTVLKSNKLDKGELLANQVKFLRLNHTQKQVAEILNISERQVRRLENIEKT